MEVSVLDLHLRGLWPLSLPPPEASDPLLDVVVRNTAKRQRA